MLVVACLDIQIDVPSTLVQNKHFFFSHLVASDKHSWLIGLDSRVDRERTELCPRASILRVNL